MPVKKNSETRHMVLDKLLRDKYHQYSMQDLNDSCNDYMRDLGFDQVDKRTTEKDIKFMMGPTYNAPIERYKVPERNRDTGRTYTKFCYRYSVQGFSILKEEMSADDRNIMGEALEMFSQFSGLPNESALNCLRIGMKRQTKDKVVGFSASPMSNSVIFGDLFKAITNRMVINLHYYVFSAKEEDRTVIVHPYYLREYNRRWYLFAAADDTGKLLSFSLDRINEVEAVSGYYYKRCKYDIEALLKKVVGVTVSEDKELLPIIFWVSDCSKDHVRTKKIHWSQYEIAEEEELRLRSQHPSLQGGAFFEMECQENYELIRELCSFGADLLVISPPGLQSEIIKRQEKILQSYDSLRT